MTEGRAAKAPELFLPVRTENNHTEIYVDGPDCLAMLLREIKNARHYINFQIMMFYNDEAGKKVADALIEKANEGVEVRVMCDVGMSRISRAIDAVFTSGTIDFSKPETLFADTKVKFTPSDNESYWDHNWKKVRADLLKKGVPAEFLVMQDAIQEGVPFDAGVIDHRKILVFDGETAVVTSMNIGNKYLYTQNPDEAQGRQAWLWHDGAITIKGPCVSVLNKEFASKWMVRGGDVFDYQKHYRSSDSYGTDVCTVYSYFPGMKENHIRDYHLRKLKECRGPLIIENPYINDELFWETLAKLDAKQAQKITLINPYKASGNDYLQNESSIKCRMWEPFQKGVKFYSYSRRMTHIKVCLDVASDEVFFGSYNLNHRSALHDFEVNILVESRQFAQKVNEMLQKDISQSTRITDRDEFYQYPYAHPSCYLLGATEYFE